VIEYLVTTFKEEDRLALMIFAGKSLLIQPAWTSDQGQVFLPQLKNISSGFVRINGREGTNIPKAIEVLSLSFPRDNPCQKMALIFTDGEPEGDDLDQSLITSLDTFAKSTDRPRIFIVVVGDTENSMRIPGYGADGALYFEVNNEGAYIKTRPNLPYLKDISEKFGATVVFSKEGKDALHQKLRNEISQAREVVATHTRETVEPLTFHLMLVSLVSLVLFFFFSKKSN